MLIFLDVTEEKFAILFATEFHIGADRFILGTMSLCIVVTVHTNQRARATACVLWDNAFPEPNRISFRVRTQVSWGQVRNMLNMKWRRETNASFDLSDQAVNFLGRKLFRGGDFTDESNVIWEMFIKDKLPGKQFAFWPWFESMMALMKNPVFNNHWNNREIVGFASRSDAKAILEKEPHGTFLIRFSESAFGMVTVSLKSFS